jgi:hypothetical protein
VLVVGSVKFALLGARQAGHRARFEGCADDSKVWRRLPGQDAARRVASVGAVEVEPYAPDQVGPIVFAKGVVRAGSTAGDAVEALLNAAQKQVAIQGTRVRMQLDDLSKDHVLPLLVRAGVVQRRSADWAPPSRYSALERSIPDDTSLEK